MVFKRLKLKLYFSGKVKNDTEVTNPVKRFYSLPSNCSDLGRLGYTLNGFYLVNGTNNRNIEIVLCRFQQPVRENKGYKTKCFLTFSISNCFLSLIVLVARHWIRSTLDLRHIENRSEKPFWVLYLSTEDLFLIYLWSL